MTDIYVLKEHPGSDWFVRIESREHGSYPDLERAKAEAIDIARDNTECGVPSAAYLSGPPTECLWPIR